MDYLNFKELYHHGVKGMKWGIINDKIDDIKDKSRHLAYKGYNIADNIKNSTDNSKTNLGKMVNDGMSIVQSLLKDTHDEVEEEIEMEERAYEIGRKIAIGTMIGVASIPVAMLIGIGIAESRM